MAKRIEEKFFKGAFHSFFAIIEGCSSVNDFNYYTIHNKYGKELPNINGYYMYVCFRKFREQLTQQHEDKGE